MNKVITYLLNLAMENMIGIDLVPLSPETASMAITDENRIIINRKNIITYSILTDEVFQSRKLYMA